MAKKLLDFVPERDPKSVVVSARVDLSLYEAVNKIRKESHHQWADIVQAGLKVYLIEMGADQVGAKSPR